MLGEAYEKLWEMYQEGQGARLAFWLVHIPFFIYFCLDASISKGDFFASLMTLLVIGIGTAFFVMLLFPLIILVALILDILFKYVLPYPYEVKHVLRVLAGVR